MIDKLVFWISIAAFAVAVAFGDYPEPGAICGTDTECAQHCPPPADDPDCDGGPQS
jgi:hypothetical protein